MYYENLQKVINYIEDNLENEIDLKQLSKLIGMNDFILQRIFVFITDITLSEYIKKRRLSKAYEELKNTKNKIIDIAIKYQYQSATSFTRSFKNLFGITPKECRESYNNYKLFPVLDFKNILSSSHEFDYKVENISKINLYCFHIFSDDLNNLHYKIRNLYKEIKNTNEYKTFNQYGMYGIMKQINNKYHYFVGSKYELQKLERYNIEYGMYAIFSLNSREQKDIVNLYKQIYRQWFPSTNYHIGSNVNFELYNENKCYIYVSIK